jgi:Raf kinase inhibitor-like YbhB/YbcL family protein
MRRALTGVALTCLALAGCGGGHTVEGPPPAAPERIALTSPAFRGGGTIPERFTCDGEEVSPPLAWRDMPSGARSAALLVEDPDAPKGTFVHWTVWDLPARDGALPAGRLPAGARQGENSFGKERYGGPCPPEDDQPHRYVFTLYALNGPLGLDAGAKPEDVRSAIGEHALARGELTGRFGR